MSECSKVYLLQKGQCGILTFYAALVSQTKPWTKPQTIIFFFYFTISKQFENSKGRVIKQFCSTTAGGIATSTATPWGFETSLQQKAVWSGTTGLNIHTKHWCVQLSSIQVGEGDYIHLEMVGKSPAKQTLVKKMPINWTGMFHPK